LNADGSITVNSDTVEIFTYNQYTNIETTYTFSPDNGYMAVMDGEIVVRGQNIEDFRAMDINDPNDDLHGTFPQATTGAAIQSPYVSIANTYMTQANRLWSEIFQIVRENCTGEYNGANPQDDVMERLLRARKGNG